MCNPDSLSPFRYGVCVMVSKSPLRPSKPDGHRRQSPTRPGLEELEPRLTPAEVGLNDFRLSFMGTDGDPRFDASNPAVAYNPTNNEFLVVWAGDDVADSDFEIYGQRVSAATGALLGSEIRLSNADFGAGSPAVAYNARDNEYLVVWDGKDNVSPVPLLLIEDFEVFGQRVNAATGALTGGRIRVSDMGNTDGDDRFAADHPAVAYNGHDNEYLVVWRGSDTTKNEFEIYGQRLSAAGAEINGDFRISDMGPDDQTAFSADDPAVAYNARDNEYLVVWWGNDNTGSLAGSGKEIFGQRLAATGDQTGVNDFRISDMGPDDNPSFGAFLPAVAYNGTNNEYL